MNLTIEQYNEIMALPHWTIYNDPPNQDLENSNYDHYYTEDIYARTPIGIIRVKGGRIVNGASIPYLCQWLIPKSGKWNRPSAFHDVGFEDGGFEVYSLVLKKWVFVELPQKTVDLYYLRLMEGRNVKKWKRYAQYRGLRLGGWIKWNEYRKKD